MSEVRTTSSTGGQKGVKAERIDLVPPLPLLVVSRLYAAGAEKYAEHNWRKGYEWSKSYASLQRHAMAFWSGQDLDEHEPDCPPDCTNHTEQPHLASVIFHAMALIQFTQDHPEFDDRYKA